MRRFVDWVSAATILCCVACCCSAWAGDTGVTPRDSARDYPVQGQADTANIAATILAPNQVSKLFSADIARDYLVVEVAIYPGNGVPFDVAGSDFTLRVGPRFVRADRPTDVIPWQERRGPASRLPVEVTAETGVGYGRGNDPANGTRPGGGPNGAGTYSGVGVSGPAHDDLAPLPPAPAMDPRLLYEKIEHFALPEGTTRAAVAGYLYFPQHGKRKKSDEVELKFTQDASGVDLLLVKPKP